MHTAINELKWGLLTCKKEPDEIRKAEGFGLWDIVRHIMCAFKRLIQEQ